jgi:hypothetical protein
VWQLDFYIFIYLFICIVLVSIAVVLDCILPVPGLRPAVRRRRGCVV